MSLISVQVQSRKETGTLSYVTSRARLFDLCQEAVPVAINAHADQTLAVATRFTLDPERLTRAGPIGHVSGPERSFERLAVHPCQHQDVAIRVVLRNDRNQPVTVVTYVSVVDRDRSSFQFGVPALIVSISYRDPHQWAKTST